MNKQIEELAEDIGYELGISYEEEKLPFSLHTRDYLAKVLIEKGYQKVDKDKQVVLTKEEYEKINLCYSITRKETAREILNKVKLSLEDCSMFENVDLEQLEFDGATIKEILNEIAKQYGVDLGEEQ